MKIFLPFTIKGIGGTSTFALKFKAGMEALGHQVFFEKPPEYDVLFLIVQAPFRFLIEAKLQRKRIVQRLDGTYYWSVAQWMFPLYNLKAFIIRHFFADFTVYQSRYSKHCAEIFLGKKRKDPHALIYNGVDTDLFHPSGKKKELRKNPETKIFFTASAFRRTDQIEPILLALEEYKKRYTDNFIFLAAGPFSGKVSHIPEKWAHFSNAQFIGKIANADLPEYERSADLFLFTHLNPPCPNNVIEALACGLPVCGVADGAMPELIETGRNGELFETKGEAFWKDRERDPKLFSDMIGRALESQEAYAQESRKQAEDRFSLQRMLQEYEKSLHSLIN